MPVSQLALAEVAVEVERRGDRFLLRSGHALPPGPERLGDLLREAASRAPDRRFLIEREAPHRLREVSYREALAAAEGIAARLAALGDDGPVAILSGNSVDHALLAFGAHLAGVPIAPISPAYSLMSRDFGKLRHVASKLRPSLIYVESHAPFAAALAATGLDALPLWTGGPERDPDHPWLRDAFGEAATTESRAREAAVGPSTVAKILFTSGSTGIPKGVVTTHGMLTANQRQIACLWPFLRESPPVIVDWLPWSHCFGGSHDFYLVPMHAGTLFVDEGKPSPALFGKSLANLRSVSPTLYFNVPAGFAALVPALEADAEAAARFFAELKVVFYAGAALPDDLWQRLIRLAKGTVGEAPFLTTAWGSTETSPLVTSAHFPLDRAGNVGVPAPGVELSLVPNGAKLEVRVKGPNVMQGYLDEPALTAAAFDDEGYYCIGDAVRFADPDDPAAGLLFDGRVAEDFKLASGTWVHVSAVRTELLAAASPALQDLVVAGHDRAALGVMVWASPAGLAQLEGDDPLRAHLMRAVTAYNRAHPENSRRIARLLVLDTPADIDAGEITDKGYVNQRATLERRAAEVERLFAADPDEAVLVFDR